MDSLLEVLKKKALQTVQSTGNAIKNNILLKPGTSAYSMTQPVRDFVAPISNSYNYANTQAQKAGKGNFANAVFENTKQVPKLFTQWGKQYGGTAGEVAMKPLEVFSNYAAYKPIQLTGEATKNFYGAGKETIKGNYGQAGLKAGVGSLQALGAVASFNPLSPTNLAFTGGDMLKGAIYNLRKNQNPISGAEKGLTGERYIGLGDALTDDPTLATIGNVTEIAAPLLHGGYKAFKSRADAIRAKGINDNIIGMHPDDIKEVTNVYKRMKDGYKSLDDKGFEKANLNQLEKDSKYIEGLFEQHISSRPEDLKLPIEKKVEALFDQAKYNFRNRTPAFGLVNKETQDKNREINTYLKRAYKVYDKQEPYEVVAKLSDDVVKNTNLPKNVVVSQAFYEKMAQKHPEIDKNKLFSFIRTMNIPDEIYQLPEKERLNFFRTLEDGMVNIVGTKRTKTSQSVVTSFMTNSPNYPENVKKTAEAVFSKTGRTANPSSVMQSPPAGQIIPGVSSDPIIQKANSILQEARDFFEGKINDTMRGPVMSNVSTLSPEQQAATKKLPGIMYGKDPVVEDVPFSVRPKTDIKNQIKDLRKQAQESILEQKLAKGVLKEELAPFTKQDLQDFSAVRKMANSREGAAGDIETLYKKNPQLVTKVLERVREQYRNIDTDEEALNKLMSMPKKSDTYVVKPPEYAKIQALKERLKTASDMVYHAEPNIYRRRAIFRNQEYKDWAAAVYKDTAKAEKETLEKNIDTVVNAIKGSFDKVKPTPKQKIGIFDLFRTPEKVLNKIGLGYEAKLLRGQYEKYLKELPVEINKVTEWSKRVTPEGNVKIFRYLDGSLTNADLTPQELKVAGEIKTYLGEWADKLNLPKEKRITNYITHIFDQDFIQKEFDPDIAKLIRDKVPGSVYDPFVEKRLGKLGYKEDTWSALDAYIKRGVRKFNMDPALAKIKDKAQYLEESQYDYVKNYIDRINMRPTKYDNLIDNTIKQVVGYKFGQRPVTALTQKLRQTVYRATLGLNIGSAMRNLTQGANTYAKLGEKYTVVGYTNMIKNMLAGSDELKQVGVLSDDIIQDRTINATKKFWENADKGLFVFFNLAEKINRGAAYYGAKAQGIAKGMDEEQAIEYARKLVRDTQFSFGSIDTPAILQSDLAKTAMQFQSYNVKQAEFLAEMAKNKDYKGLARFTGASLAMVYTVGQLFGMKPTDLIPFYDQLTGIGEGKLPQSPLQTLATGVSTVGDLGSEDETKKNKAWQNLEKSAALTVPAGSQIRKTLRGLEATSKGYSESLTGRVQFPVAQTPVNTIRAGLFGKSNLPESQQYFNSGETVLGEKQSQRLKESNDKQGVYESVLAEREANRKQSQINEIKNSILDSYLTGDIARAKQLAIENKINLTKKDAKQYQNKIKSDILDFYIDGNMVKAEDTAKKYKINLTRADLKKRAKSRAIALYKKAKSLDNQILMNEAERLAKQYGLIITRKDVE